MYKELRYGPISIGQITYQEKTNSSLFKYILPRRIREMIDLMPTSFPKRNLPKMNVYKSKKKKFNSPELLREQLELDKDFTFKYLEENEIEIK